MFEFKVWTIIYRNRNIFDVTLLNTGRSYVLTKNKGMNVAFISYKITLEPSFVVLSVIHSRKQGSKSLTLISCLTDLLSTSSTFILNYCYLFSNLRPKIRSACNKLTASLLIFESVSNSKRNEKSKKENTSAQFC